MISVLLIANIACFVLQTTFQLIFGEAPFRHGFALSVDGLTHWRVYQLITFQFLHGDIWHLLMNLLGLYFFGRPVEDSLGRSGVLKLYLLSGTVGGLAQIALGFLWPDRFGGQVLGASAGVFGLIAAFAISRMNEPITLLLFFVLPVTFRAKYFLAAEAAITVWGLIMPADGIAHGAHLGGMLAGAILMWKAQDALRSEWSWPTLFHRTQRETRIITPSKRSWRATAKPRPDELPSAEFISSKVDPILDKISAQGIHSLTDEERQILESAHNRMTRK
jgi:membrane associated rhomboid family serine protease